MAMLSDCDIAGITETVVATLNQVGTILRPDRSSDDMGGQVTTWREVETDVACRIRSVRLRYQPVSDRIVTITSSDLVVGTATPLLMGDRMIVDGDVWHVDGVPVYAMGTKSYGVTLLRP